jgi:hypothetical protein
MKVLFLDIDGVLNNDCIRLARRVFKHESGNILPVRGPMGQIHGQLLP